MKPFSHVYLLIILWVSCGSLSVASVAYELTPPSQTISQDTANPIAETRLALMSHGQHVGKDRPHRPNWKRIRKIILYVVLGLALLYLLALGAVFALLSAQG